MKKASSITVKVPVARWLHGDSPHNTGVATSHGLSIEGHLLHQIDKVPILKLNRLLYMWHLPAFTTTKLYSMVPQVALDALVLVNDQPDVDLSYRQRLIEAILSTCNIKVTWE